MFHDHMNICLGLVWHTGT